MLVAGDIEEVMIIALQHLVFNLAEFLCLIRRPPRGTDKHLHVEFVARAYCFISILDTLTVAVLAVVPRSYEVKEPEGVEHSFINTDLFVNDSHSVYSLTIFFSHNVV